MKDIALEFNNFLKPWRGGWKLLEIRLPHSQRLATQPNRFSLFQRDCFRSRILYENCKSQATPAHHCRDRCGGERLAFYTGSPALAVNSRAGMVVMGKMTAKVVPTPNLL